MPLFHRGHYNILAAQFKKSVHTCLQPDGIKGSAGVVADLAISLAHRLKEDNPNFDPIKFLESCSSDPENYPIQELWEE